MSLPFIDDKNQQDEESFDPPISGEPRKYNIKRPPSSTRRSFFDEGIEQQVLEVKHDSGCVVDLEHGLETDSAVIERWFSTNGDPLSAKIDIKWYQIIKRDTWDVYIESEFNVVCDHDYFYLNGIVTAYENSKKVFLRNFNEKVFRDFV